MAIDKEAFAIIGDQLAVIELLATDLELVKAALPAEMRDRYQYVAKRTQTFSLLPFRQFARSGSGSKKHSMRVKRARG